jgi:hypothetical protein
MCISLLVGDCHSLVGGSSWLDGWHAPLLLEPPTTCSITTKSAQLHMPLSAAVDIVLHPLSSNSAVQILLQLPHTNCSWCASFSAFLRCWGTSRCISAVTPAWLLLPPSHLAASEHAAADGCAKQAATRHRGQVPTVAHICFCWRCRRPLNGMPCCEPTREQGDS